MSRSRRDRGQSEEGQDDERGLAKDRETGSTWMFLPA